METEVFKPRKILSLFDCLTDAYESDYCSFEFSIGYSILEALVRCKEYKTLTNKIWESLDDCSAIRNMAIQTHSFEVFSKFYQLVYMIFIQQNMSTLTLKKAMNNQLALCIKEYIRMVLNSKNSKKDEISKSKILAEYFSINILIFDSNDYFYTDTLKSTDSIVICLYKPSDSQYFITNQEIHTREAFPFMMKANTCIKDFTDSNFNENNVFKAESIKNPDEVNINRIQSQSINRPQSEKFVNQKESAKDLEKFEIMTESVNNVKSFENQESVEPVDSLYQNATIAGRIKQVIIA